MIINPMEPRNSSAYPATLITVYRMIVIPVLLWLMISGHERSFLYLVSFNLVMNVVCSLIPHHYKKHSYFGTKVDALVADTQVVIAVIVLLLMNPGFTLKQWPVLTALVSLFLTQQLVTFLSYRKITMYHTWLSKLAAMVQAVFFLVMFFTPGPHEKMFYVVSFITALEIIEEILLVVLLPEWKGDVPGLYSILRSGNSNRNNNQDDSP